MPLVRATPLLASIVDGSCFERECICCQLSAVSRTGLLLLFCSSIVFDVGCVETFSDGVQAIAFFQLPTLRRVQNG
jgi:hypothetical protein